MAIVRREISDRTAFGKFIKWTFIIFNVIMLVWLIAGFGIAGDSMSNTVNEAERAGAAIGSTLGLGMIIVLWALGDVILGLFVMLTRRKKTIEVEE